MNLEKLFSMQKVLDDRILEEHPELKGQNNLDWKILALQVELGECANEWRGFKKWSKDQRPRKEIFVDCKICDGTGDANYEMVQEEAEGCGGHEYIDCESCEGSGSEGPKNPLLEEFVDCVHFFISIAIELGIKPEDFVVTCDYTQPTATLTFNRVFSTLSSLDVLMDPETPASISISDLQDTLYEAFSCFVGLGEKFLGFTWEQIEQAYISKNEINHARQSEGY